MNRFSPYTRSLKRLTQAVAMLVQSKRATPAPKKKPAKRKTKATRKVRISPVVRYEAPVEAPKPRPVEDDDARIIRLTAEAQVQRPAPVPTSAPVGTGRKQCSAVSAATGRRCGLLENHEHAHRHGQTAFWECAVPGQTYFPRLAELEQRACVRDGAEAIGTTMSEAQRKAFSRRMRKQGAHNGADTTTGLESIDRRAS